MHVHGSTPWPLRLEHAEKMDAVARVAGGLSHDVGNLVDEAASAVREAMVAMPPAATPQEPLEQAAATLKRAAMIARQLHVLAEEGPSHPERRHLARTVDDLLPLVTRLAGPAVRVVADDLQRDARVSAGAGQLEQVLFHLAVNARDAMPAGGVLRIEARAVTLDVPRPHRFGVVSSGSWCVLAVSDTGTGMSEAVLQRLFEPFFTTKAPGMGSGLGLATVYGIAQQLGGQVIVESREGEGTTVELWLPRAEATDLREGAAVLVVHGDPWLRSLSARSLRRTGYRVLEAGSSAEAVGLLDDIAGQEIAAVAITPSSLPGESGPAFIARLAELHPALRIVTSPDDLHAAPVPA